MKIEDTYDIPDWCPLDDPEKYATKINEKVFKNDRNGKED